MSQGTPCVAAIKKFERFPGYAYEAVLAIQLRDAHCVLSVDSIERGTTGVREAIVTAHLMERGELSMHGSPGEEPRELVGWFLDPYLDDYPGPTLHSLSDDVRLDALFPKHPLSKVRRILAELANSLSVDTAMRVTGAPSVGPEGSEMSEQEPAERTLSLAALGTLYGKAGRAEEAIGFLRRSMEEAEQRHGPTSPQLADASAELGLMLLDQGQSSAAQVALARAADIYEGAGRQRQFARSLLWLAFACERLARRSEAETALRKSLAALGDSTEQDPLRAQVILNLGRLCVDQQKVTEAESLFEEAQRLFASEDPLRSSNLAIARNGLGLVCIARGRYKDAIPLFEMALQSFLAVHGPDFPDVATVLRNMAFAWGKLGNEDKANQLLQRAAQTGRI